MYHDKTTVRRESLQLCRWYRTRMQNCKAWAIELLETDPEVVARAGLLDGPRYWTAAALDWQQRLKVEQRLLVALRQRGIEGWRQQVMLEWEAKKETRDGI